MLKAWDTSLADALGERDAHDRIDDELQSPALVGQPVLRARRP